MTSYIFRYIFALLVLTSFYNGVKADIVINEFLASNNKGIADEDGEHHDWIELFNSGELPVNLEGYGITDDPGQLKWTFPDVTIQPGGYMLIFASGKDRRQGELHTNFRISKSGEPLILEDPDGFLVDMVEPLHLPTDISYGRGPDGADDWYYFDEPTPGHSNELSEKLRGLLDPPGLSHKPGFYEHSIKLKLSSEHPDAEIYYTLDGSIPTTEDRLYTKPVHLKQSPEKQGVLSRANAGDFFEPPDNDFFHARIIRAVAVKPGYKKSTPRSATYLISPEGADRYTFPVISLQLPKDSLTDEERGIYVQGAEVDSPNYRNRGRDWERAVHMEFIDAEKGRYFNQNLGLRIHGSLTRMMPKKSFRLYARREYGTNPIHYDFFPDEEIRAFKRLILRQSGSDWGGPFGPWAESHQGVLFRDALAQELVKDMAFDVQAHRPAVLFLNGEYWGIYNIRERFDRFYAATNYGISRDKVDQLERNMNVDEGSADHYKAMWNYIENNDLAVDEHYQEIKTRMDVQNFIEYVIAKVFLGNTDWPDNNIRYWRKQTETYVPDAPYGQDGRWRWLMYDMDFALSRSNESRNLLEELLGIDPDAEWATFLFRNLKQNEEFLNDFVRTYCDHLNTTFTQNRTLPLLEQFSKLYAPEMPENINRWGAPESMDRWIKSIRNIRTFLHNRPAYAWKHLKQYTDHGDKKPLVLDIDNREAGYLKLNSLILEGDDMAWKGDYFGDLQLEVQAVPYEGKRFRKWSGDTVSSSPYIRISVSEVTELKALFEPDPDYERPYSLPIAHKLEDADYKFDEWHSHETPNTWPDHMVFHQMGSLDPGLDQKPLSDYTLPYNLSERSRINGLGEDGFAFINTSNPQEEAGAGFMGAAVLALDSRKRENIRLSWQGETVIPNVREYGIRVQYRTGQYQPFRDLRDSLGNFIEYIRHNKKGHSRSFKDIPLPSKLEDKERIELRFKYYYRHNVTYYDPPSGPRAKLAVNYINVTSDAIEEPENAEPEWDVLLYPNPSHGNLSVKISKPVPGPLNVQVFNLQGKLVSQKQKVVYGKLDDYNLQLHEKLDQGFYIIHLENGERKARKKMIVH